MALGRLNGRLEVLAHELGCEAWPGCEIPCFYGLALGIYNRDETGHMQELHQGGQHVHVICAVVKDVGLGLIIGCTV